MAHQPIGGDQDYATFLLETREIIRAIDTYWAPQNPVDLINIYNQLEQQSKFRRTQHYIYLCAQRNLQGENMDKNCYEVIYALWWNHHDLIDWNEDHAGLSQFPEFYDPNHLHDCLVAILQNCLQHPHVHLDYSVFM